MPDYRLDSARLDTTLLDGSASVPPSPPTDDIYYGSFGLQNANVITQFVRVSPPVNALSERGFPREDGEYAETAFNRKTLITITGALSAASQTALELLMDQMGAAFAAHGQTLKLTKAGAARFYDNCYAVNIETLFDQRDHYHVTWVPFTIQLVCMTPFAHAAARDTYSPSSALTASPTNIIITNAGNAKAKPILTLTFIGAGTASDLTVLNAATGETIKVTSTFADGDQIDIDGENKTVKKNGAVVDYAGVIPSLAPGDNALSISVTGAGWSLAFSEQHYARYY